MWFWGPMKGGSLSIASCLARRRLWRRVPGERTWQVGGSACRETLTVYQTKRFPDGSRGHSCFMVTWQRWTGACWGCFVSECASSWITLSRESSACISHLPSFSWWFLFKNALFLMAKKVLVRFPITRLLSCTYFVFITMGEQIKDLPPKQALKNSD